MFLTNLEQATILIVDDNPTNLKVLCAALADSGWVILVATDGETAVERAEYTKPDLILLDVMMPGIDGFETCRKLKENYVTHDIPVIFMTALSETVDKVTGLSLGAVDYITKPFKIEEVIARIQVHLKLHSLTKQLADQKMQLEQRVAERTAQLSQALHELQQSQVQLVQSEKMSALGQLVAGVAHEVNNPLGFLTGNLVHLYEYIFDLINHLQLYRTYYPDPVKEIDENAAAIDLEELIQDLPQVISSMKVGIERICNISNSLRTFSRADSTTKVPFNINEGIDSTLLILKYRLKANNNRSEIEVIKNYGELPQLECYPGQLNQVFMNIVSNAIDAFDEYSQQYGETGHERGYRIIITTEFNPKHNWHTISIRDNGPGMPAEVKKRAFDNFFTTKSVGKGTGLGLSISRQIVEDKHQGKLKCISALGQGTKFVIQIPSTEIAPKPQQIEAHFNKVSLPPIENLG